MAKGSIFKIFQKFLKTIKARPREHEKYERQKNLYPH